LLAVDCAALLASMFCSRSARFPEPKSFGPGPAAVNIREAHKHTGSAHRHALQSTPAVSMKFRYGTSTEQSRARPVSRGSMVSSVEAQSRVGLDTSSSVACSANASTLSRSRSGPGYGDSRPRSFLTTSPYAYRSSQAWSFGAKTERRFLGTAEGDSQWRGMKVIAATELLGRDTPSPLHPTIGTNSMWNMKKEFGKGGPAYTMRPLTAQPVSDTPGPGAYTLWKSELRTTGGQQPLGGGSRGPKSLLVRSGSAPGWRRPATAVMNKA